MVANYSVLKGIWKGLRPALVGAAALIVGHFEDVIPKEYLTPVAILVVEFIRNYMKQHQKSPIAPTQP